MITVWVLYLFVKGYGIVQMETYSTQALCNGSGRVITNTVAQTDQMSVSFHMCVSKQKAGSHGN